MSSVSFVRLIRCSQISERTLAMVDVTSTVGSGRCRHSQPLLRAEDMDASCVASADAFEGSVLPAWRAKIWRISARRKPESACCRALMAGADVMAGAGPVV